MENQSALPEYQCHKKVRAAKITGIQDAVTTEGKVLIFGELKKAETVSMEWFKKHSPVYGMVGGYFVVYEDGYTSFSPGHAFEGGYTRI